MRLLAIVVAALVLGAWFLWWAFRRDSEGLLTWWNSHVKRACDAQDGRLREEDLTAPLEKKTDRVVSYFDAWAPPTRWVHEFHRMVNIYHGQIMEEVEKEVRNMGRNLPGEESHALLEEERRWNPLWVKFLGRYGSGVPTLRAISSMFPEVHSLYVSVFHPGTVVADHNGISRSLHRYHYGLKIPQGEAGIEIGGKRISWTERAGFVWDPTVTHSAWNRAEEPCIIIVADIERDLGWHNLGTRFVYWLLKSKASIRKAPPNFSQPEEEISLMPEWSPSAEEAPETPLLAVPAEVVDDE